MLSVFEYFNFSQDASSTPLPKLAISTTLYQLQKQSEQYFQIPDNAKAKDEDVLAVEIKAPFILEKHSEFLENCTKQMQKKLQALEIIDKKIAASFALGTVALTLSFIPFVGYFSTIGFGATAYFITQRTQMYAEYKEALHLLVGCCNWSLGPEKEQRQDSVETLVGSPAIENMMTELYPVLTEKQARHLIADDIENKFTEKLNSYEEKFKKNLSNLSLFQGERIALSKKAMSVKHCVYGLNKGKPLDFLDAFLSIVPDLYNAAVDGFKRMIYWLKHGNQVQEISNTESKPS